jgi:hypothetical protein
MFGLCEQKKVFGLCEQKNVFGLSDIFLISFCQSLVLIL